MVWEPATGSYDSVQSSQKIAEENIMKNTVSYVDGFCEKNNIEKIDSENGDIHEIYEKELWEETEEKSQPQFFSNEVMTSFLESAEEFPLFTPEEEKHYGKMLRGTEEEREFAKEQFVIHNVRLVISIAKRYRNYTLTTEDLVQEGMIGLLNAINRYDVNVSRFSTYATWWIRQAIIRSIHDTARMIRIPAHMEEKLGRYRKLMHECEMSGITLSDQEIMEQLGIDQKNYDLLTVYETDAISLNMPTDETMDTELEDFLESPTITPEETYLLNERKDLIDELTDCLTLKEKFVIKKRFGLDGESPKTLEELGTIMHVTRERIRQIEKRALIKMKNPKRLKMIENYFL